MTQFIDYFFQFLSHLLGAFNDCIGLIFNSDIYILGMSLYQWALTFFGLSVIPIVILTLIGDDDDN